MELKLLANHNPWWENKEEISKFKGIARTHYKSLINSISIKEVSIITGPRRVGKSTIMYQMISKLLKDNIDPYQILFVNLEDIKISEFTLESIYSTYRESINPDKKAYIFFDEIHNKDMWEKWIRSIYDKKEDCKFVVSGSCSHLLKKEYSTLLTGRNITFEVYPLSFQEYIQFINLDLDLNKVKKGVVSDKTIYLIIKKLDDFMNLGGFPEIILKEKEFQQKLLAQYFDDILYKDIIDRNNITSKKIRDLAIYLATNFTNEVSLRNVRNSLGLSYDSIKDYLSYFIDAYLFFLIDSFSYSFKEQKTRPSKAYCIDNGLRNSVAFLNSKDTGKLAENLVFLELKKRNVDFYYWKEDKEVDFIVKKGNSLNAINVTYGDEIDEREIKSLKGFKDKYGGKLLLLTKNIDKKEDGITFMPLWRWILTND
jgi:uncharacterized protein